MRYCPAAFAWNPFTTGSLRRVVFHAGLSMPAMGPLPFCSLTAATITGSAAHRVTASLFLSSSACTPGVIWKPCASPVAGKKSATPSTTYLTTTPSVMSSLLSLNV